MANSMIITTLMGGLGNQMFQYAAGRRLAYRLGVALKLDLSRLGNEPTGVTPRCYALDHFPIHAGPATCEEVSSLYQPQPGRIRRVLNRMGRWQRITHIRGSKHRFEPEVLQLPDGVLLDGYWQSERYFSDIAAVIRNEFAPLAQPEGHSRDIASAIEACTAVSIHIRRGDYVTDATIAAKHGTCSALYYQRSVDLVAARTENPHFFVFTDDPVWVRDNFQIPHAMTLVDHNGPGQAHEDLMLMSACRHHIIANSSLSWWGAWLDPRPDKIVIAPSRWFIDPAIDARDLTPESWLRVAG